MRLLITLLLSLCFTVTKAQLSGDTYASAKASGKAVWTFTYANAPGFAQYSPGAGITFDLMEAFKKYIEEKEGIEITIKVSNAAANDFTRFLNDVKSARGGVFGLSNTTITQARKKDYNFSSPYITNIGMIISHKNAPTLASLSEISTKFKGMTAVTVRNSTNARRILELKNSYYPTLTIEYVPSFQDVMDKVAADKTKFTDIDFTYYLSAVQSKLPVKRHAVGDDSTEKFGIIMPKSNDWAPLLNEFMADFVGTTEYKKILASNLGSSAMKYLEAL